MTCTINKFPNCRTAVTNLLDYLAEIAKGDGVIDYLAEGNSDMQWLGAGPASIGGVFGRLQMERLLLGAHPSTGEAVLHPRGAVNRRNGAFGLTFESPKEWSLLKLCVRPDVATAMAEIEMEAATRALAYLESSALFVRAGSDIGGERVRHKTTGLFATVYRHGSSRALDPHAHIHALIANLAQDAETGDWKCIDFAELLAQRDVIARIYDASLNYLSRQRLGMDWQADTTKRVIHLRDFPRRVIDAFSKRRKAIVEYKIETGRPITPQVDSEAWLKTRPKKERIADAKQWAAEHLAALADLGFGVKEAANFISARTFRHRQNKPLPATSRETIEDLFNRLADPTNGITRNDGSFTLPELIADICLLGGGAIDPANAPALAEEFLARCGYELEAEPALGGPVTPSVAANRNGWMCGGGARVGVMTRRLFTTTTYRQLEAGLSEATAALAHQPANIIPTAAELDWALARLDFKLTAEQLAAVKHLLGPTCLSYMFGPAGAGKSTIMRVCADVLKRRGGNVIALAPTGKAAESLGTKIGGDYHPVAWLAAKLAADPAAIKGSDVIVIDEACQAANTQLAPIIEAANRVGARVIALGDIYQHDSVGVGGWAKAGHDLAPESCFVLSEVWRQRHLDGTPDTEEIEALAAAREGDGAPLLQKLDEEDRIFYDSNRDVALAQLVADWGDLKRDSGREALVIAHTNEDRHWLNAQCQGVLDATAEQVSSHRRESFEVDGRRFCVGDTIAFRANNKTYDLRTGYRAIVEHIGERITIRVDGAHSRRMRLPKSLFADRDFVDLGFAVTEFTSQGAEAPEVFVAPSGIEGRQGLYTAFSRSINRSRGYLSGPSRAEALAGLGNAFRRYDPAELVWGGEFGELLARRKREREGVY